jgi:hypothetical protein
MKGNKLLSLKKPTPWQPRPGWGTVRNFTVIANDRGGTDMAFNFIPDDGSAPVPVESHDITAAELAQLGEYARGVMSGRENLDIKVSATMMIKVEEDTFRRINELKPSDRALMYAQRNDVIEDCGWTWTSDHRLEKAAPGLTSVSGGRYPTTPTQWRPRPGWGTIRNYQTVANDHGGTDLACKFVPDDGSDTVPLVFRDVNMPELGEYARGVVISDHLTIKASASTMLDAEHMFEDINRMAPTKRALLYMQDPDGYEEFGWAWTSDYKLVRAAPGLM